MFDCYLLEDFFFFNERQKGNNWEGKGGGKEVGVEGGN